VIGPDELVVGQLVYGAGSPGWVIAINQELGIVALAVPLDRGGLPCVVGGTLGRRFRHGDTDWCCVAPVPRWSCVPMAPSDQARFR
jgi:hypothetical protein